MSKVAVSLEKSESIGGDAWCVREMDEDGQYTTLLSRHGSYAEAVSTASCLAFEAVLKGLAPELQRSSADPDPLQ